MKSKPWTEEELKSIRQPATDSHLAKMLNRSKDSIRNKRKRMGIKITFATPVYETTVTEDVAKHDESFWQREFKGIQAKYTNLLKEQTVVDRLVSQVIEMAPKSYSPLPLVKSSGRESSGKPQSAVLMFSDTHIGKTTSPKQTLSFGSYDFHVFMARLKFLEESIISIKENHMTTEVPELVIAMMGDMLDGTLTHSNEAGQADPIFNQFFCGAHVIAQFFRNLAAHFPKLRIYNTVGNHPRFQNQRRMPAKNRYSNFDQFLYAMIRELVRDIPTIEWELDMQPYQIFEVNGFTFFTAHGDSLRGGDKTLGVPNHAVGRLVSTATQLMNKYNRKAPNYYLVGHLHRDIALPHATGSFLVNGGFPGVDEFGLAEMFTPADPSQKLFFVHPKYGKTATHDIALKFAEVNTIVRPYTVPEPFTMS